MRFANTISNVFSWKAVFVFRVMFYCVQQTIRSISLGNAMPPNKKWVIICTNNEPAPWRSNASPGLIAVKQYKVVFQRKLDGKGEGYVYVKWDYKALILKLCGRKKIQ